MGSKITLVFVLLAGFGLQILADSGHQKRVGYGRDRQPQTQNQEQVAVDQNSIPAEQKEVIEAISKRKELRFVTVQGLVIIRMLPNDNEGLKHQKFVVRLADGKEMTIVYNTSMCPRVPVKEHDIVNVGGNLTWNQGRPLIHWTHHDPKGLRPDGYVEFKGQKYCVK